MQPDGGYALLLSVLPCSFQRFSNCKANSSPGDVKNSIVCFLAGLPVLENINLGVKSGIKSLGLLLCLARWEWEWIGYSHANIHPPTNIPEDSQRRQWTIPTPNKEPLLIVLNHNARRGSLRVCVGEQIRYRRLQPRLSLIHSVRDMWWDRSPNQTEINTSNL